MERKLEIPREGRLGTRDLLNEEVAVRLLGYRWVVWREKNRFPLPSEETGRFLAPPNGALASIQVPAGPGVPFAKEPDRYVPMFTTNRWEAFEVAASTGLFSAGNAHIDRDDSGEWRVTTEDGRVHASGRRLSEALCRAALQWHEVNGTDTLESQAG